MDPPAKRELLVGEGDLIMYASNAPSEDSDHPTHQPKSVRFVSLVCGQCGATNS